MAAATDAAAAAAVAAADAAAAAAAAADAGPLLFVASRPATASGWGPWDSSILGRQKNLQHAHWGLMGGAGLFKDDADRLGC